MRPGPARRGALGYPPQATEPDCRRGVRRDAVPLRRARRPRARTDLLLPGPLEREAGAADAVHPDQRQRGRHLRLGLGTGGPYSFTAPEPPPGRFLFSVALCNDLHMGETEAGHVGGAQITGVEQVPGRPPYPEVMLDSLVHDAGKLDADFLLAAGDISAEAVPVELSKALQLLKKFGRYRRDYFVARGNHDRAHDGDVCRVPGRPVAGQRLLPRPVFPGRGADLFARELRGLRVIGIDTYDKPGRGNDAGALSTDQLAWFRAELLKDRDQPTLVFGHHPLAVESSPFPITPSSSLDAAQAATSWTTTPALPDCSCITPGTPTATSAPSARAHPTSRIRRSPPARGIPAASRAPAVHRGLRAELLQEPQRPRPGMERTKPAADRGCRHVPSAAASRTATPSSNPTYPTCDPCAESRTRIGAKEPAVSR